MRSGVINISQCALGTIVGCLAALTVGSAASADETAVVVVTVRRLASIGTGVELTMLGGVAGQTISIFVAGNAIIRTIWTGWSDLAHLNLNLKALVKA
jgi:hypothetical protein